MASESLLENNNLSILNEVSQGCEKLIAETQNDLELFRKEQQDLKTQLLQFKEENQILNSKLDQLKKSSEVNESIDDATRQRLNNEAIKNVKIQIDLLENENKDLKSLNRSYQNNIEHLEKEIKNYRQQLFVPQSACEVQQKYKTAIQVLENTIVSQKSQLKEKSQIIDNLFEQRNHLRVVIEKLQKSIEEKNTALAKYNDVNDTIVKVQHQLQESIQNNKELEKTLKEKNLREQITLQKIQDSLDLAEAALAEKEEALNSQRVVKEECENIASTIVQVMDEAARKVENDMQNMRREYLEKEKILIEQNTKLREDMQNRNKLYEMLNTKCKRFEQKYKDVKSSNDMLVEQLELFRKTIHEMKKKIEEQQDSFIEKRRDLPDEQEVEIKFYVEKNKQLHESYRLTLQDITKLFEQQIYSLQTEVANLKAENKMLKSKISLNKDQ
ncbi:uncharacterized protein LOC142233793 [Haematobia irritans]|uniref:uncharacterized protein LOC142233793 n=1 Tax=Haematobia irritans TaxID=7368 RepID=UPI003F4FD12E